MNVAQIVADYGQRIGQPGLHLPPSGPVVLQAVDGAPLLLEADADALRLYLLVPAPFHEPLACLQALQAAHLRRVPPQSWPVRVGARGQGAELRLMYMVCLGPRQASVMALEQAAEALRQFRQAHGPALSATPA